MLTVRVEQRHLNLSAIPRVDRAWRVHQGDPVLHGKTAARHRERHIALGQRNGHACGDQRTLTRLQHERLGGTQIGTGIVVMRIDGGILGLDGNSYDICHPARVPDRTASRVTSNREADNLDNGGMQPEPQSTDTKPLAFKERLIPGAGLFIALFLLAPAGALVVLAFSAELAIPIGLVFYATVMLILSLMSPVVKVENGTLSAGDAHIPVAQVGRTRLLGADEMKRVLGVESDARNFLVIRGWVRTGIEVEIADPADPTPNWVISTRRPQALADAIDSQRA